MKIGIVILNFNAYLETLECIESLLKYDSGKDASIIVVDNGSPNQCATILRERLYRYDNVTLITSNVNLGFSGGNNLGIKKAMEYGCESVFLLNSDVLMKNDAISIMQKALLDHEEIGIIGPIVYNLNNENITRLNSKLTLWSFFARKSFMPFQIQQGTRRIVLPVDDTCERCGGGDSDLEVFSGWTIPGCCLGLSASFIRKNKVLDDAVFLFWEEDILSQQADMSGFKTGICREACITHKVSKSIETTNASSAFLHCYSWPSTLYVMGKYVRTPRFLFVCLYHINKLLWKAKSLKNDEYRKLQKQFLAENDRLYLVAKEAYNK